MQQKTQQKIEITEPTTSNQQQPATQVITEQETKIESSGAQRISKDEDKIKQLIQTIRDIQNEEVEQELHQALTEAKKDENKAKIRQITKQIILLQYKIQKAKTLLSQQPNIQPQKCEQLLTVQTTIYQPDEQELNQRYEELVQQPNDSNWTDATQSQADDDILVLDDDIINAMEESDDEQIQEEKGEDDQQGDGQKKEEIDLDQLEDQFVTGEESDHHGLFGKHDKFCVSVNGIAKESLLVSGGGDDYLYMYRLPKDQLDPKNCLNPYHIIKHTETVNKIEISFSKQYIFSMTDNEILCTQIKTQQTTNLKSKSTKQGEKQKQKQKQQKKNKKQQQEDDDEQPICSDMVCHHLGDVVAVSSGFQLEVYNVKGLKLYQTYYCERQIDMIAFTQTGKQIVLGCSDSRLRLLTPRTSEIVAVTGTKQHQNQLTVIKTKGDIILSGCLDGYIGISTIKKASMTTLIGTKQTEETDGAINQLEFAGSYFISGSAEDKIDWYDLGKAKKLFTSPIEGSSSDICWQGAQHQHLYNVSTIKGYIHIYDCRNPLKQVGRTRAGNTIHKLWSEASQIVAACEDGHVRYYDIRKLI